MLLIDKNIAMMCMSLTVACGRVLGLTNISQRSLTVMMFINVTTCTSIKTNVCA